MEEDDYRINEESNIIDLTVRESVTDPEDIAE
jgi:hypothetical protein